TIAVEIENPDLAKKFYERAESKMTSVKDLTGLAQAVVDDLKDKEYAKGIYERAEQSIEQPGDLMILATDIIKNLDDKVKAKDVYKNTLAKIEKFPLYLELFDEVVAKIDDKEFGKEILANAETFAETTPELLQVTKKIIDVLQNKEFAAKVLGKAEEFVTNLNEMKDVTNTVKEQFSDNADWAKRVDEKLEKREKNQEKYEAYQKREEAAVTFKDLRLIVDDMMAELDDKYYAQKLLKAATELLNNQQFNVDNYRKHIQSIAKYLNDDKWIKDILNNLIDNKVKFFFDYCGVCHIAAEELIDKEAGKKLAESYLKSYEKNVDAYDKKTAYNYTDLAKAVFHITGDGNWSIQLLDKADQTGADFFAYAYMGHLAGIFQDEKLKQRYFEKAVEDVESAEQFHMLAIRLKAMDVDSEEIRELYAFGTKLSEPQDKLLWAEGIADIFGDKKQAAKIYGEIASDFKSDDEKEIFETSKKIRLEGKFW
ncbi:hypothetical protein ACFLSQ_11920, partial [Bacteroidota bacterium]